MSGGKDLEALLANLDPMIAESEYVFVTRVYGSDDDVAASLESIATFREKEGLTLIVDREVADRVGEAYNGVFRMITLQVHSSLEAVGLTAAVATKLAEKEISANVVAAFHHDHVFVPAERAADAMEALSELQSRN